MFCATHVIGKNIEKVGMFAQLMSMNGIFGSQFSLWFG